jgi:hypothetical protein
MAAVPRAGLSQVVLPWEGPTGAFGRLTQGNWAGQRAGLVQYSYGVPYYVVTPDGLVILVGAPYFALLGVPA